MGLAYIKNLMVDAAIEAYQKAINLAPGSAQAHYDLAVADKAQGSSDLAIAHYQEPFGSIQTTRKHTAT